MFNNSSKTLRIIALYLPGLICLVLFFFIHCSNDLAEFLTDASQFRADWGFGFYAAIGVIKLVLLVAGITIPCVLTVLLLRRKWRDK